MIEVGFEASFILLVSIAFLSLYRAIIGPTIPDRILAVAFISTKITAGIIMVGVILKEPSYFDIAILYGLLSFVATLAFARFLETGRIGE